MSASAPKTRAAWLTWSLLTVIAAVVYIWHGVQSDSQELYTRLWSFQLIAFVYTRSFFMLAGMAVSIWATTLRRLGDDSVFASIVSTAAVFLLCELMARLVWGR